MKRKSERRRAESRKKRCAAPGSCEAEPNSSVYTEITGKLRSVCGTDQANFQRSCSDHAGERCVVNEQVVCKVFFFVFMTKYGDTHVPL